jgi:hypothetical protein
MVTYEFVATSGQTTFSGTDANGATLSYVANSISVSLNGVTLRPGDDYTATNGTSVVLNVAAALNDDLMVIAFAVFNVANAVAKTGDTMTGSLLLPAGTVSAPALTTSADTNTGIFFPAADTIAFAEGGTEVARFDSSGNLLVGTSTGNISTITVATADGAAPANGSGNNALRLRSTTTAAVGAGPSILFEGQTGNSTAQYGFAAIQGFKGSSGVNDYSGVLAFYTQNSGGSAALTERMRIDSSGNVGIGTSSPITRLHVLDSLTGGQFIVANSETNSSTKYGSFGTQHYTNTEEPALCIAMESASTENNVLIGGALGEFNAATTIKFYTAANNTTVGGTERMRIDSSGNLLQTGVTTASGVLMSGLGSGSSNSTTNSATYNVTINGSAKVFWVFTANGDGCLVVTNYTTATITILGTGGVIVASASPASNQLGISKSANSHVVTFKTGSAASTTYGSWGVGSLSSSVA